jgi:hypothetical protein
LNFESETPSQRSQTERKRINMKKVNMAIMAGALAMAFQAHAQLYNITFTQTGESDQYGNATPPSVTDAIGQIDVSGGYAISGSLDVLSGPDIGNYILVPGSGDDGVFQYDNVVITSGGPFLDSTAGLLWSVSGTAGNSAEMNMWYNSASQYSDPAGTYSLWGAPPNYNPEAYGTATLTPAAVPEASTAMAGLLMLLPLGFGAFRTLRKQRTA